MGRLGSRSAARVAATGQQTVDRDVLINGFPMKSITANIASGSLLWCRVQQTREPGHWNI